MRVLIVSSYPPRHCGIAVYASAQVERLRADGDDVLVISPPDGDGDVRVPFEHGLEFREARLRGADRDLIIVHFQPSLYYARGPAAAISKIRTSAALLALVRARPQVELLVHEATPHPPVWRPDHLLLRSVFAGASLVFHTDSERRSLERDYHVRVHDRRTDHRAGIQLHDVPTKEDARRRVRFDPRDRIFLCAGFFHPWKGFDRAIQAFAGSGADARLVIVGSVREETKENLAFAEELHRLAGRTAGVELIEGFQSDEDFDVWIRAADRVVIPYRRAWSSGALARANTVGTPAIVSDVGGLAEQVGPRDVLFRSDEELRRLFRDLSRGPGADPAQEVSEPTAS
jgi:glycosyltransferase involved in cell wall biosynthesis